MSHNNCCFMAKTFSPITAIHLLRFYSFFFSQTEKRQAFSGQTLSIPRQQQHQCPSKCKYGIFSRIRWDKASHIKTKEYKRSIGVMLKAQSSLTQWKPPKSRRVSSSVTDADAENDRRRLLMEGRGSGRGGKDCVCVLATKRQQDSILGWAHLSVTLSLQIWTAVARRATSGLWSLWAVLMDRAALCWVYRFRWWPRLCFWPILNACGNTLNLLTQLITLYL